METLRAAFSRTVDFLPDLIAGAVVVLVGWAIAALLRRVIVGLLPRAGFDRFLSKYGLTGRPPESRAGSRAVGTATFWVVMLIALMQAANIWRLSSVAGGLARVLAYLPNVVAAVIIFGAAFIVASWVGDRLRESPAAQRSYSAILPGAVRAAILTIGAFVALRQLLIAPEMLVIAFTLVFGAIAVATALAFGLGGRRAAERMTDDWYEGQRARRRKAELEEPGEPRVH
jgi:hypothetical protein